MNLTHKREDIYRSIIEGISYGANHILEIFIESSFKPKKLFAVGGGVKIIFDKEQFLIFLVFIKK